MNRKMYMWSVLSAVLLLGAGAAQAQRRGPGPDGASPFGGPMELMGFEGVHHGMVVKGAPFTATMASETNHTLQDGTVIHRTSQGTVSRDSSGRTRKELSISGFGPLAASGGKQTMVMIADPVAGAHYMLDANSKVAHKLAFHQHSEAAGSGSSAEEEQKWAARKQQEEASGALKTESLGTQMVNGVSAEGTRTTHTIAAGQIGNDKPIQIVSEKWYSPDLQIVVKSTRTDPQSGTTTYSVTNIQKAEPAAGLFAVPADYTVTTEAPRGHGPHGPGPGGVGAPEAPEQE